MTLELDRPLGQPGELRPPACQFCFRRLGDEFYFTCRTCRRRYCYIHMSRHMASCEKRRGRMLERPITLMAAP